MNSRKILIVVIVLVLAMLVVGAYFIFSSSKTTPAQTQTGQTGTLPAAGNQTDNASGAGGLATGGTTLEKNFGVILNQPVLAYFVDASNNTFTIQPDGEIDETSNGQTAVLNSLLISNIISAGFSYDGSKVFVNFGNPTNPQTSIFDTAAKTWTPMGAGWQSPVWSPSDYRIAYVVANAANGTETFSTFDTSKSTAKPVQLLKLHAEDLSVAWPNKNQLVLATKPSALVAGSSWLFNLQDSALTPISIETPGLETMWGGASFNATATMGLQLLAGSSGGGSLQLIDTSGKALQQIKFLTVPSKCTFASSTTTTTATSYLYCGVPRDQSDLAFNQLPDDYNQMKLFTVDDIYRINLADGAVDTVFNDQTQNLDASDLELFNNTVFFINRYDQKLYAITLN